jgi:hypothetical protein
MNDAIWEAFDGLFKALHRQGRRVEELEARVVELERRLQERAAVPAGPRRIEERVARLEVNVSELRHVTNITEADEVREQFDPEDVAAVAVGGAHA